MIKRVGTLLLVLIFSIESFAAIVSDNDGSAFITKAEFDSLKNDFQAQIDNYNTSIDSKIDGAIAAYLAGIVLSTEKKNQLLLWSGKTLGLVEDHRSHPYVEGTVGGDIKFTSYVPKSTGLYNGNSSTDTFLNISRDYFAFCHHELNNKNNKTDKFKYLATADGKIGTKVMFDIKGYAEAQESIIANTYFTDRNDYTYYGCFAIGLCGGWDSTFGTIGEKLNDRTVGNAAELCESLVFAPNNGNDGNAFSGKARSGAADARHNKISIAYNDCEFKSEIVYDRNLKYLTNAGESEIYKDIWTEEWYGINKSNGNETHPISYDLYAKGLKTNENSNNKQTNFHIKVTDTMDNAYGCGNYAFMRKYKTGSITNNEKKVGWLKVDGKTNTHYKFDKDDDKTKALYKASTGDFCTSDNLYSSEIGELLDTLDSPLVSKAVINKQETKVAPLYVGLPIANIKKNNQVKIELEFLDNAKYEIAFMVGGFPKGEIEEKSAKQAGCTIVGGKGNIKNVIGKAGGKKETIKVNIEKTGILFFKFAVTGDEMGRIKLPTNLTVVDVA